MGDYIHGTQGPCYGFDASGTFTRWGGANIWKGDAAAGTKILATRHDDHDQELANGLSECLTRSGKGVPTTDIPWGNRKITNLATPVADTDAATKKYIDDAIVASQAAMQLPPGVMMPYAKFGVPAGWLYCNGQPVSRATYSVLFAVIGTTFGVGDGATTFQLPDMRGEFVRGLEDGRGLDPGRVFGSAQADDLELHTHTASTGTESADHVHLVNGNTGYESTTHYHDTDAGASQAVNAGTQVFVAKHTPGTNSGSDIGSHTHAINFWSGGRNVPHTHAVTVTAVGGTETRPHNLALVWIIKT